MVSFPAAALGEGLLWSALGLAVVLTLTFLVGRSQGRHVVIDTAWGLGFVVVAAITWVAGTGHGDDVRRLLLLVLTALWGLRLAAFLAWRSRGGGEDSRYEKILGDGDGRDLRAIARVYLPQGLVLLVVSMVQQVGMLATGPLTWVAWTGVGLWLIGMLFEVAGDAQLAAFRADPARRGTVLDSGAWAWTRHPNYFGDAAVWWGMFLVTASAWPGVLTVLSPLLMTWALAARTGKPLTERRMADRPGYADYVRRTSGFVPLPPKRS